MHISYRITLCTKMAAMAVAKLLLCCDINIGVAVNDGGNAHAALALDSSFQTFRERRSCLGRWGISHSLGSQR